jgi:nicotinate-nucleotide--dimethylbenzimidazole phosphoribosyltransferase
VVEGVAMSSDLQIRTDFVLPRVRAIDPSWTTRAVARLDTLAKPPGSLGRLESVAARLCAIQQTLTPRTTPRRIAIFAADHGVAEEGVSAYPASVTAQMVANFLNGGAAINALARTANADLFIVDVGVGREIPRHGNEAAFLSRRVRAGTRNMTHGSAMTADECNAAIEVGLGVAEQAAADRIAVLACGDMGIANSTAASAITAAIARVAATEVTGRGTGVDDPTLAHKVACVTQALRVSQPGRNPIEVLRTVGGLEVAAIVGAYLGAAAHGIAIVGDGFITTAAAMIAAEMQPAVLDYWFAGHLSPERGHAVQLRHLRQEPLLALDMRLGEGTGAALAMHVLGAAAAVMNEMATFTSAGVDEA